MIAVVKIELRDIIAEAQTWAAMLADPRVRRIYNLNRLMVELGALRLPEVERAALRECLERLDDAGIALLLKALQARQVAAS